MSMLIYFYKYARNLTLTESEIEMLNEIYFKHTLERHVYHIFLKWVIILISVSSIARILYLAVKLKISNTCSFIFSVMAFVSISSNIIYVSFVFWSTNNVFRTQWFPGSTGCPSKDYLRLEATRDAWYHWTTAATLWLTIFIGVLHLDYLKKKELLPLLNASLPPLRLSIGVISLLLLSTLLMLEAIVLNETIPYNETCYVWKTSLVLTYTTLVFEELGPSLVILVLAVMIKIELIRKQHRVIECFGKRAIRLMSTVKNSARGLKQKLFYLLVIMFATSFPSSLRHFLIIVGIYDTENYLFDEKLCDLMDCLILISSSFPAAFCFSLKRHLDIFERVLTRVTTRDNTVAATPAFSFTLIDLLAVEHRYNDNAEKMYEKLQSRSLQTCEMNMTEEPATTHLTNESSTSNQNNYSPAAQDQG